MKEAHHDVHGPNLSHVGQVCHSEHVDEAHKNSVINFNYLFQFSNFFLAFNLKKTYSEFRNNLKDQNNFLSTRTVPLFGLKLNRVSSWAPTFGDTSSLRYPGVDWLKCTAENGSSLRPSSSTLSALFLDLFVQ